jgi:hypothetical protein
LRTKRLKKDDGSCYVDMRFWKEPVSDVKLISFEHWSGYVIMKLEKKGLRVPPLQNLRNAFDRGMEPRDFIDTL